MIEKEGKIWAIGGGKGGTGKTFVTSAMGTYIARKGKRVTLIDIDIGGANLHSFLGISRPKKSLTDFFEAGASLNKLAVKTGVDNMSLITGDIHSLASDNIKFTQKLKLFRHIMKLNKHYVIIDLGAGSHNNTLDTFLMADKKIVILEPEITSVENMYHFIKNALFRKLRMSLREYGFKDIVEQMWERREEYGIKSLRELIDSIRVNFSHVGDIIDKELSDFKLSLVLNKIRSSDDILIGSSVKSIFMKYLGVDTKFAGFVEYDDSVWKSVRERRPFMLNYSLSRIAKEVEVFTENLLKGKEIKLSRN
ncbi:MAG TPA: MinD/ParA family protein [Candidatus Aminicenantes bacterium]|nr:MinD/ParA family protein [Candidatus Aminicenantes bacterium]HEB36363.1 MinD/ParA family protein [Candidatus Aminicenantes bacterium]